MTTPSPKAADPATAENSDDDLFALAASAPDDDRRRDLLNQVVERYVDFAHRQASRYAGRGIPLDDLKQVAAVALTYAARRYDPSRGSSFLSFAGPTVRGELRKYFRDHGWTVRPTRAIQELQARSVAAQEALAHELGRSPTPREVAEHLDEPLDRVIEALTADGCFVPVSLDRTVDHTDDVTLGDTLVSSRDPFATAEARLLVGPAVRSLSPRDREVLRLRFFGGLTQSEIAERIGTTQMTVSRMLSRILRQLRRSIGVEEGAPRAA